SVATLDEAIATMAAGAPKGVKVDDKLKTQKLSKAEAGQLKAFLLSLSGEATYSKPYFHDGSVATLDEAIATMAAGAPKGVKVDDKLKTQKLSKAEAGQLKAFLLSLSGEATYSKPYFHDGSVATLDEAIATMAAGAPKGV